MVTEDQSAVIEFLQSPSTHDGAAVERIDTHSAIVFLAGSRAWKLKRAVRYDYLDFSISELRRRACEAEMRLNLRTAPALYRRVVPVTREGSGALALGGAGVPVDWLVEMNRFDQEALLDRLAVGGQLTLGMMTSLGSAIARFHLGAERRPDHGGCAGMRWVVDGNALGFREFGERVFEAAACARVTERTRAELDRAAAVLERRRDTGFVRHCHGDLHLRNIVLLDGQPTLFDGVEFNDEIACVDVLYDLAFLLMDLWRRRLPLHANAVWNSYLGETGDLDGLSLMPLFLSCRAAVRAKTSATAASIQKDAAGTRALRDLAREYLSMAETLLDPPRPRLIAIGGYSGSGKSTLARALAPSLGGVPGAVVLRSDEIRKRLCRVPLLERLGPEAYTPEVSARVYATLVARAALIIRSGRSVIVDAVHSSPGERLAIEHIAAREHVAFSGLWLDSPEAVLLARVGGRRGDVSDAGPAVVRLQHEGDTGVVGWHRLDASGPAESVLRAAHFQVLDQPSRATCGGCVV
jgi:aminoglycoside phosphotransferase family enzyme/predicted kinase